MTVLELSLLDPLFFFTREYLNGHIKNIEANGVTANQQIRQQIMFGESTVSEAVLDRFTEYAKENSRETSPALLARERTFIRDILNYNLAMATFGTVAANRAKIESDTEVLQAINALPKAARLDTAAQKARTVTPKEKGSLSLVLNEQR